MRFKYLCLGFVAAMSILFFSHCARIVAPTGGPKDTVAPKPISFSPEFNASNFDAKKIVITFDEFFALQNISQRLLVSPPMNKKPEVKQRSKKLIINLKDCELKENTTYTISLPNAIADITEKNLSPDFRYSFSTGQSVDSLMVAGRVLDASTLLPVKGVSVLLHANLSDTAFLTTFPEFFAKTDDSGRFVIRNVKDADYHIFALDDKNNDLIFNQQTEAIAYLDDIIHPTADVETFVDTVWNNPDSLEVDSSFKLVDRYRTTFLPDSVELSLFIEPSRNQYLVSNTRLQRNLFVMKFNIPIIHDSLIVRTIDNNPNLYVENVTEQNDSICVWLNDEQMQQNDSLQFVVEYYKTIKDEYVWSIDTLSPRYSERQDPTRGVVACKVRWQIKDKQQIKTSDKIEFSLSTPMSSFDKSKLHLYRTRDTISMLKADGSYYNCNAEGNEYVDSQVAPILDTFVVSNKNKKPFLRSYKFGNAKFAVCFSDLPKHQNVNLKSLDFPELTDFYYSEYDAESNCWLCWINNLEIQRLRQPRFSIALDDSLVNVPLIFDEYERKNYRNPRFSKLKLYVNESQAKMINLDEMLEIICANPIKSIDTSKISVTMIGDSSQAKLPIEVTQSSLRRILIAHKWQISKRYVVQFEKGAITDVFGQTSKEWDATLVGQSRVFNSLLFDEPFTMEYDTLSHKFSISAKFESKNTYRLSLDAGFATDIFGYVSDTSLVNFSTQDAQTLGVLKLSVNNVESPIIVELWDNQMKKCYAERNILANGNIEIRELSPMEYRVRVIFDDNNNGKFDSGNMFLRQKPERVAFAKDVVRIKSNWDTKLTLDLNELINK